MDSWYCIHTKPQKESFASSMVSERLGLEIYLPLLRQQKTIRRVRRVVTAPLFPRYFFARFDLATHLRAVRYSPDVLTVVNFGGAPAQVGFDLIEELRTSAGENEGFFVLRPDFQPGESVEITEGPMRGSQAIVLRCGDDRDRVAVLLSILETNAQVNISRSHLSRAV